MRKMVGAAVFVGALLVVSSTHAADLPVKAKPVEYVKICSLYGAGFYYIPGTDICLRVGGYSFIEAGYNARAGDPIIYSYNNVTLIDDRNVNRTNFRARGTVMFWNKVYEGGFTWMSELSKFGAHVVVSDPHRITVFGAKPLRPAVVEAPYVIRAAVALYMVAASIPGKSVVKNADTIMRAHPNFVENLRSLGAEVEWK